MGIGGDNCFLGQHLRTIRNWKEIHRQYCEADVLTILRNEGNKIQNVREPIRKGAALAQELAKISGLDFGTCRLVSPSQQKSENCRLCPQ